MLTSAEKVHPSASQTLGYQAERKLVVEDSAERLLLKSPTELGFREAGQEPLHLHPQQQVSYPLSATNSNEHHRKGVAVANHGSYI